MEARLERVYTLTWYGGAPGTRLYVDVVWRRAAFAAFGVNAALTPASHLTSTRTIRIDPIDQSEDKREVTDGWMINR